MDIAVKHLTRDKQENLNLCWKLVQSEDVESKEHGMIVAESWIATPFFSPSCYANAWSQEFARSYHEMSVLWLKKNERIKAQECIMKANRHYDEALDIEKELAFDLQCVQCNITPTLEVLRKVDELAGEDSFRLARVIALAYLVNSKIQEPADGIAALLIAERSQTVAVQISLTVKYLEVGQNEEALRRAQDLVARIEPEHEAFLRVAKLHAHVLIHTVANREEIQLAVRRFITIPSPVGDCLEIIGALSKEYRPFALECIRSLYIRLPLESKLSAAKLEIFLLSQECGDEATAVSASKEVCARLDELQSEHCENTTAQDFQDYVARILWFFAVLFVRKWRATSCAEAIALLRRMKTDKSHRLLQCLLHDVDTGKVGGNGLDEGEK